MLICSMQLTFCKSGHAVIAALENRTKDSREIMITEKVAEMLVLGCTMCSLLQFFPFPFTHFAAHLPAHCRTVGLNSLAPVLTDEIFTK